MSKAKEIMAQINAKLLKKYKGAAPELMLGSDLPPVSFIPTGLLGFDYLNGGGAPRGHIEQIYGQRSCGKTSVVLRRLAEAQRAGLVCAYIDAEHTLDKGWANKHGVNLDELVLYEPELEASAEKTLHVVYEMLMGCAIDVIVVDSVTALCPLAKVEKGMEDKHYGGISGPLSQFFDKVIGTGVLYNSDANLIFINQPREVIGARFPMERLPGGRALAHYSSIITEMKRGDFITEGSGTEERKIGVEVKLINQKNKVRWPYKEQTLRLHFASGFNPLWELILFAQKYEIVECNGSWMYYNGENMGQGSGQQMNWLVSNKTTYFEIKEKIVARIKEGKA